MKQKSNVTSLPTKDLKQEKDDRSVVSSLSCIDPLVGSEVMLVFCFIYLVFKFFLKLYYYL